MVFYSRTTRTRTDHDHDLSTLGVYPDSEQGKAIGMAYYSGIDAMGEPIWSLRIHGAWLGGRWLLLDGRFVPTQ